MRALWITLLIALLPLRAWAGDAMAVAMLPATSHTATMSVAGADCPHATASEHHGQHTDGPPSPATATVLTAGVTHDVAAAHGDAAMHTDHPGTSAHLLCDVCNGPALDTTAPATAAAAVAHSLHIERKQAFESLAPRHIVEPPIA